MTISMETSKLVRKLVAQGMKRTRIQNLLHVSKCSILRIISHDPTKIRCLGHRGPPTARSHRRKIVSGLYRRRVMVNLHEHPEFPSCASIRKELKAKHGTSAALSTIRLDLLSLGATAYIRPVIPGPPMQKRKSFCMDMLDRDDFDKIVFSDEHYVSINDQGNRWQWENSRAETCPRVRERRQNVTHLQFWGAFGKGWRSELVFFPRPEQIKKKKGEASWRLNADKYIAMCLTKKVTAHLSRGSRIFMQDGASCHTCGKTKKHLELHGVQLLENWPARSPDLNPIENLWGYLDTLITQRHPSTQAELQAATIAAWKSIPVAVMDNFQRSFRKKCEKVVVTG